MFNKGCNVRGKHEGKQGMIAERNGSPEIEICTLLICNYF
jgi:hypothetical protein